MERRLRYACMKIKLCSWKQRTAVRLKKQQDCLIYVIVCCNGVLKSITGNYRLKSWFFCIWFGQVTRGDFFSSDSHLDGPLSLRGGSLFTLRTLFYKVIRTSKYQPRLGVHYLPIFKNVFCFVPLHGQSKMFRKNLEISRKRLFPQELLEVCAFLYQGAKKSLY